jgi:diguanylate cyclase (GGDEF)-like protein
LLRNEVVGVPNEDYCRRVLEENLKLTGILGRSIGTVLLRLDSISRLRRDFGRDAVAAVERMVARTLCNCLRIEDEVAVLDSGEFVAVLQNRDLAQCKCTAERLRILVERSGFMWGEKLVSVSASLGVTILGPRDTPEIVLERVRTLADHCQAGKLGQIRAGCPPL